MVVVERGSFIGLDKKMKPAITFPDDTPNKEQGHEFLQSYMQAENDEQIAEDTRFKE